MGLPLSQLFGLIFGTTFLLYGPICSGAAEEDSSISTANAPITQPVQSSVWQRIAAGTSIPATSGAQVSQLTALYANNPSFLLHALRRATPLIREIVNRLEARGMPVELALLPVIESGYDPVALSPARALGIWQFIPETGKRYGLRQTWLRDERRDPLAATDAALDYLQRLYSQFGDWQLALAAYNSGENRVSNALQAARSAGKKGEFSDLSPWLPAETRNYVPRFNAVCNAYRLLFRQGLSLPRPQTHLTRIVIDHPVDLHSLARLAELSHADLSLLNAGILRNVVSTAQGPIWLPEPALQKLREKLAAAGDEGAGMLMNLKPVTIDQSASLKAIAERQQTDIATLRRINGIHPSLDMVRSGTLFVPRKPNDELFDGSLDQLPPLRMLGDDAIRPVVQARNSLFLAVRPKIIGESGWVPGRLQLRRRASRATHPR